MGTSNVPSCSAMRLPPVHPIAMVAHISFILEPPFEIGLIVAEVCDWYVKLNGPDLLGDGPDGRTAGHANIWKSKVLHLWQNAGHLEPIRLAMQSTKCCPTFPIGCLGSSAMAMRHELYACSRFKLSEHSSHLNSLQPQLKWSKALLRHAKMGRWSSKYA